MLLEDFSDFGSDTSLTFLQRDDIIQKRLRYLGEKNDNDLLYPNYMVTAVENLLSFEHYDRPTFEEVMYQFDQDYADKSFMIYAYSEDKRKEPVGGFIDEYAFYKEGQLAKRA